jgi:hypothetical protein
MMNTLLLLIRGLVRAMGYVLGVFLVSTGILDILGLVAYSTEMPPLAHRLRSDLPVLLEGAVLLVPMRLVVRGAPLALLKIAYVALSLVFSLDAVRGVAEYLAGGRHWLIIPSSLAMAAIVIGNAILLWSRRNQSLTPPRSVQAGPLLTVLIVVCALAMLATVTYGAETPASVKQYTFELQTLNLGDQVRKGGGVKFNVTDGMSEDELDAVNHVLDELSASPVDGDGYRALALSNGTQVKIGGFLVEGFVEDSVEGVQRLPLEFSVKEAFSTAEAALVLQIAKAGNLFIASPSDPEKVATTAKVDDRRFYKLHRQASITADENALAEWIRQNIPPR